jgi:hypothetical protein
MPAPSRERSERAGCERAWCQRAWRSACALAVLLALSWCASAAAQDARAHLVYERDDSAAACPDEAALRDAVAARLGYVPFVDEGATARTVRVTVRRSGRRTVADIEVLDGGVRSGARQIGARGRAGSCPIDDALVLAVSLAIDPMTLAAASTAPPPEEVPVCPSPEPCAECAACPPPPPPPPVEPCPTCESPPASRGLRARLSLAPVFALAPLPFPTGGLRIGGGARMEAFSFDLELRGDLPTTGGDAEGRTVNATWLSLAVVLCGHLDVVSLCGLVTSGILIGWGGGVDLPRTDATGFSTLGARAGVEVPVSGDVAVTVSADAGYVLTPTDLVVDGRTLHTTSPVVASLAAGVVFEIL